jgi:hypothetical protein
MKKLLLLWIVSMSFLLIWCWDNKDNWWIPEEELPQESSICPEGFYWFDSVKRCMNIENVE